MGGRFHGGTVGPLYGVDDRLSKPIPVRNPSSRDPLFRFQGDKRRDLEQSAANESVRVSRFGAGFTAYPAGITIDIELFFPDGCAVFDFVDDVAAGVEGFAAMS